VTRPETLADILRRALRDRPDGPLCVAYSGGPDSTALLHALAGLAEARARGLRALHVDHGLHPDSARWAEQARHYSSVLEVDCRVLVARVDRTAGTGLEAAARHARYAALAAALQPDEWLLLGHHRDDQVETVLLKLLRGAGPEGLGGMREMRPLGAGRLWRPLLATPRAILRDYAARHHLPSVDDPSNADLRLSRNYLRHDILPRLREHWPHAADSILHSAALSRAAADALREQWLRALETIRDPQHDSLDAAAWFALPAALREPLLDHWLHARGCTAPSFAQRRELERQLHTAIGGKLPCIHWPGTDLHIWKGRLWAHRPQPPPDPDWQATWQGEPLALPGGGRLDWSGGFPAAALSVRLRRGGERIRPAGDRHTRELRDLFQQAALPPWQRAICPLLYVDEELVAVADLWRSERGDALFRAAGGRPCWRPAD
jgi:tRNA(Ile)-lysidine synthase